MTIYNRKFIKNAIIYGIIIIFFIIILAIFFVKNMNRSVNSKQIVPVLPRPDLFKGNITTNNITFTINKNDYLSIIPSSYSTLLITQTNRLNNKEISISNDNKITLYNRLLVSLKNENIDYDNIELYDYNTNLSEIIFNKTSIFKETSELQNNYYKDKIVQLIQKLDGRMIYDSSDFSYSFNNLYILASEKKATLSAYLIKDVRNNKPISLIDYQKFIDNIKNKKLFIFYDGRGIGETIRYSSYDNDNLRFNKISLAYLRYQELLLPMIIVCMDEKISKSSYTVCGAMEAIDYSKLSN